MKILVTGATGYLGGRLVPRLLERGHNVTVLVRDAGRVRGRRWADDVSVIEGDLLNPLGEWTQQLGGFEAAYYLVHSLYSGRDFSQRDLKAARTFASAAPDLPHLIYLGGLVPHEGPASRHLESRAATGRVLADRLPVTELRCGPIIGSGSASFEMMRYLTDRLPVMITPRWVRNKVQPIGTRDILNYLLAALEKGPSGIIEVGAEPLTFKQMMTIYADLRGYTRIMLPVPVLAPSLAARWVGAVTPVSNHVAVPLLEGIVHPVIADTTRAREVFPDLRPMPYRTALERALMRIESGQVETRWSGTLMHDQPYRLEDWEGLIREVRRHRVKAAPSQVFAVLQSMGGSKGWLVWGWAWRLRGMVDKLIGGPGLRRGRRSPTELLPGETVDFFRVERIEPGRELLLRAEMKVPGKAWICWKLVPDEGETILEQVALFEPSGATGALYWYGLYLIHRRIFSDLARAIARESEERARAEAATRPDAPGSDEAARGFAR